MTSDPYGHGTHITSIAASGAQNLAGGYLGIAPKANLVVVRAFDGEGGGRYTDVIAGLNWIVANRAKYNIRVLNLSFGAPPQSYYWDDPLNQAVMAAWRAGIVVVASAGNEGPDPMTIDVPGNVPYVITVGALTDSDTPYNATDDKLASFSSTGPTFEGFVKPELVAPGGHIAASMSSSSYLANIDPDSMQLGQQMFTMSGTSQAAAVTSGVVALMLQDDPTLTPDTVKCRLIVGRASRGEVERQARVQRVPAGRGPHQRDRGGEQLGDGLREPAVSTSTRTSPARAHFGGPANQDDERQLLRDGHGRLDVGRPARRRRLHLVAAATLGPGLRLERRATPGAAVTPGRKGYTWSKRLHLVAAATPGAGVTRGAGRCPGGTRRRRAVPPAQARRRSRPGCRTSSREV